jgi:hypothetical protein
MVAAYSLAAMLNTRRECAASKGLRSITTQAPQSVTDGRCHDAQLFTGATDAPMAQDRLEYLQ